ncbi:MAG TPA: hypothetical protein VH590_02005 [Ktedonobacterales bacterium]|jgi:hypothetical protein
MNMQQFKGWIARLLNALPWRRAPRASKSQTSARVTSPAQANHVTLPENRAARRQKAETNPLCSTLSQDEPAAHEPPPPLLLPAPRPPEASSFPLMALPPPAMGAADAAPSAEVAAESPQPPRVDPERRLAFARYLFKRGVFNEGFTRETLPAQYWEQTPDA